jgi:hypothetical protein
MAGKVDQTAIEHLKQAVAGGKDWFVALLEAIGLWQTASESYQGRLYRYLIDGEAFDWWLLAERLCAEVDGLIPEEEKMALFFTAKPPHKFFIEEIRELIGETKYRGLLNYFYGIVIEEALLQMVEEEIYKERRGRGITVGEDTNLEAYRRIYGSDWETLLTEFRNEKGYSMSEWFSLTEQKEFTYWLFKYRLKHCEKAKVASDTKRALQHLQQALNAKRNKLFPAS